MTGFHDALPHRGENGRGVGCVPRAAPPENLILLWCYSIWHALKLVSWSSAERYIYIAEPFDLDYASVVGVTQCSYSTKCTYLSQKLSIYMEMNEFAPAL